MIKNIALVAVFTLALLLPSVVTVHSQSKGRSQTAQKDRKVTLGPVEDVTSLPTRAKRYALVIGIDQYLDGQITPLKGATNDAKALADALMRYAGFPDGQVALLTNDQQPGKQPTRANILGQLAFLRNTVPKDGMLLVAFAGHGIERSGTAYLLPSDARVSDIALLEDTAISIAQMKDRIRSTGVDQVVLILDACRNDPVSGRGDADNPLTEAYTRGFNFDVRNKEVKAFVTLFATSPGQRAYEFADKKQGYFTYSLIEALKGKAANENGEVTLAGLVKYLQREVPKQVKAVVGKEQKPYYVIDGYKAEDLVISVTVNVGGGKAAEPEPVSSKTVELAFWDSIKSSSNSIDFRAYLEKYSDGDFAILARNRIAGFEWDSIRSSSNPNEFKEYLKKYPNGEFAELAKTKISALEAAAKLAEPVGIDPALPTSLASAFVKIPAGEFMMGSNNSNQNDERPAHRVRISRGFEMGKYEVTQAQWEAVMGNNPSKFKGADLPVETVSWEDVRQFIQKLNDRSKKYYYRLPTEAEWEYACRAGSSGDYAGSLDQMAWYINNSGRQYIDADQIIKTDKRNYFKRITDNGCQTHPVGQKQANAWGLYDMHGNVWEWCQDWYDENYYGRSPDTDPTGPSTGSFRVFRGGSWVDGAVTCRSAYRRSKDPGERYYILGFRLLRTAR